jgi:hypothetical protein
MNGINGISGLIIVVLFYFVMWLLSSVAKKAQEKEAELQQDKNEKMAAKQQEAAGRAEPRKKYRQLEELRHKTGEAFVPASTVSPPPLKRESVFDALSDGVPDISVGTVPSQTGIAPQALQPSEYVNPIAQEIMAMMTTPQSMQQVVILSEIFNRPKSVSESLGRLRNHYDNHGN